VRHYFTLAIKQTASVSILTLIFCHMNKMIIYISISNCNNWMRAILMNFASVFGSWVQFYQYS